jgi:hypothetical protein
VTPYFAFPIAALSKNFLITAATIVSGVLFIVLSELMVEIEEIEEMVLVEKEEMEEMVSI